MKTKTILSLMINIVFFTTLSAYACDDEGFEIGLPGQNRSFFPGVSTTVLRKDQALVFSAQNTWVPGLTEQIVFTKEETEKGASWLIQIISTQQKKVGTTETTQNVARFDPSGPMDKKIFQTPVGVPLVINGAIIACAFPDQKDGIRIYRANSSFSQCDASTRNASSHYMTLSKPFRTGYNNDHLNPGAFGISVLEVNIPGRDQLLDAWTAVPSVKRRPPGVSGYGKRPLLCAHLNQAAIHQNVTPKNTSQGVVIDEPPKNQAATAQGAD